MNINIFNVFKYPLSPNYKEELKEHLKDTLSKFAGVNEVLKADLHIKDEKNPKSSKKGYYKVTLSIFLHKKKPIIVHQKGVSLGKTVQKLMDAISVTLEKSKNKNSKLQKFENNKFKKSGAFLNDKAA